MTPPFLQRTFLLLALLIACSALRAQDLDSLKTWSVEEFAQRMTDQMTTEVPLRPDQVEMVHRINTKFSEAVMPVVKGKGDQQSIINAVKQADQVRSDELEVFLNPEQMRKVRLLQQMNRKKLKQRYYEKNL